MEEVIRFPQMIKTANLDSFGRDLRSKPQDSNKTFAFYLPTKCRNDLTHNLTTEQTGIPEWISMNLTSSDGISGSFILPTLKAGICKSSSPFSDDPPSTEEEDKELDEPQEENYFSSPDEILFVEKENEDDLLLFHRHSNNDYNDDEIQRNSQKTTNQSTYQPILPLVLNNFQPPTTESNEIQTLSFQQLLTRGLQDQDSKNISKHALNFKTSNSSQLPPISDFQIAMKLNDDAENSTSLMDEGNPTVHLFDEELFSEPILVEPLNLTELDASHTTWGLEHLLNLPLSVTNSSDEQSNKIKNTTQQQNTCIDFYQSFLLPTSIDGDHTVSFDDHFINSSFLPVLQTHSDPLFHPSRDKQANQSNDQTKNYTTWNHFGSLLEGVHTLTCDDNVWLGGYTNSMEMGPKEDMDLLDGNDEWSENISAEKCKTHSFPSENQNFLSIIEANEGRNGQNLNKSGGTFYHDATTSGDSKHLVFNQLEDHKREKINPGYNNGPRKSKRSICLWQFLKELLLYPDKYQSWIKWVDRHKGVFKIEDSVNVARLWGERKNKPAMNYDKLSRSIRQYYKKGIIKKTSNSKRLVYQFCPQYLC